MEYYLEFKDANNQNWFTDYFPNYLSATLKAEELEKKGCSEIRIKQAQKR